MLFVLTLIVLAIIFLYFKSKSRERSAEFGKETRYIAIEELGVHPNFYTYITLTDMEQIKSSALQIKKLDPFYASLSWPRLLAWTIYAGYKLNCHNAHFNNDIKALTTLLTARVPNEVISKEAETEHKVKKFLKN